MDILDQYCAEVGRHLPRRQRADIEAEIRATLDDILKDRSRASGQPIDDALVAAVLKEYGAPAKVAAAYKPEQALIGPRLYPTFELVLKIVLAAVVGGMALGGLIASFVKGSAAPDMAGLLRFMAALVPALTGAFGSVVLIFAVFERLMPAAALELREADWDPARLARQPNPNRIQPVGLILNAVFNAIGLIVLNVYPNAIGFGYFAAGQWVFVPVMSSAFLRYLPWVNLLGLAQIVFSLFMLRAQAWQTSTRLASLVIRAANLLLLLVLLADPNLIAIAPEAVAGTPLAAAAPQLVMLFRLGLTIGLAVAGVAMSIEIAVGIYRLLARPSLSAWPMRK
jgi:hypothetical protein